MTTTFVHSNKDGSNITFTQKTSIGTPSLQDVLAEYKYDTCLEKYSQKTEHHDDLEHFDIHSVSDHVLTIMRFEKCTNTEIVFYPRRVVDHEASFIKNVYDYVFKNPYMTETPMSLKVQEGDVVILTNEYHQPIVSGDHSVYITYYHRAH